MTETDVFRHSTPSLYHRYMGPLLFEPYAKHIAERLRALRPNRILETAAGTGIVTRAVNEALPNAQILATDINPAVVEFASQHLRSERVTFQRAVARVFRENPRYMERGPFSYTDPALVERDLQSAGFEDITVETVQLANRVTTQEAAQGIVLGSPFRAEIERLDSSALERALAAVTEALLPWDGKDAPMSAHVATATR